MSDFFLSPPIALYPLLQLSAQWHASFPGAIFQTLHSVFTFARHRLSLLNALLDPLAISTTIALENPTLAP